MTIAVGWVSVAVVGIQAQSSTIKNHGGVADLQEHTIPIQHHCISTVLVFLTRNAMMCESINLSTLIVVVFLSIKSEGMGIRTAQRLHLGQAEAKENHIGAIEAKYE